MKCRDNSQSVVISDSFWKRKFNRDPNALGKTFNIDGAVSTVVGVMPRDLPPFTGGELTYGCRLIRPMLVIPRESITGSCRWRA